MLAMGKELETTLRSHLDSVTTAALSHVIIDTANHWQQAVELKRMYQLISNTQ